MNNAVRMLFACALVVASVMPGSAAMLFGGFSPGTGASLRSSTNYVISDTLGQFAVGVSYAPDDSYSCGIIEHGFWHSDVQIPNIAQLKQTPNDLWVDAYAKVVTAGSDQFSNEFYVSEQDRSSVIRVNLGANPLVVSNGDMVDVSGIIKGTDSDRYIDYPIVVTRFPGAMLLSPYFITNHWLGGKGTDMLMPGGSGLLNTEMLLKVSGTVTYVDTASPVKFFYIDDGSGLSDGQVFSGMAMCGIQVYISGLAVGNTIIPPVQGQYVTVTGICATYSVSGKTMAQVRPRNQADIEPLP